ncbi:hypothetical protein RHSIM_Rhsim07G0033600 [Rhododendron simsii]|uniref:Uncharacterized protein n=1 Tax=Rhododendron simsii TaxID=118357 RepID=A0A834LI67_RHOSS|nr:hypothetical protein RHSIM_Rhsim07G0033600 [Rhododendron simsii]
MNVVMLNKGLNVALRLKMNEKKGRSYSDYENRKFFSLLELDEIGKKLGLNDALEYYYKAADGGFKIIQNDDQLIDMVNHIKDNVIDIFLVIPNTILDDLLDVDVGNWEWESGTFPKSGVTIADVDMIEGLGGRLADDDSDSDANYDYFHDRDYDLK